MLIDNALYQEVDRIAHGYYHECPFPVETWVQRIEHLGFFVADDAISIVRCCAQLADAADAAVKVTGRTPLGDRRPWRSKIEEALDLSLADTEPVFMACAGRAAGD